MGKRGRPPHPDILTPREWQVLDLLRQDLTNEQIAQRLDISFATAKYHVAEIISKLGVATREEAAAWQPELAPARPWWAPAFAILRRGWPLAGTAAALTAVGTLTWFVLRTPADDQGDAEGNSAAERPTSSATRPTSTAPSPSPSAIPDAAPVILNEPVQYAREEVESGGPITEEGAYLLEVETGRLWHRPFAGQLSPDGSKLALTQCCAPPGSLEVVDFETGIGTRIVESGVMSAHWTPDGTHLVFRFTSTNFATDATFIISIDGTGLRSLPDGTDPNGRWSGSGRYVAFETFPTIPEGQRQLLNIVNLETESLTNPLPLEARDDPLNFAWSPVDDRLAYATKDGLFYLDPATGESTTISGGPIGGGIQWSPDGLKIVAPAGEYVPSAIGVNFRVQWMHIFDVAGQHPPIELPPGFGHSWSPDRSRIAYQDFGCVTREWDIYTVAPDGSDVTRLTLTPDQLKEGPYWSPDGSMIAFATPSELRLLNLTSLEETVVATTNYDAGRGLLLGLQGAAWTPDGRFLQFGAGLGGHGICS